MKKAPVFSFCIAFMIVAILAQSCSSVNRTQKGTALGAAAGGAIGALIGKKAGNPAIGATIGAALGGSTGAFLAGRFTKTDTLRKAKEIETVKKPKEEMAILKPEAVDRAKTLSLVADSIQTDKVNTLLR